VYNSYGLTEMNGPGVAFECEHKAGLHLWEDNYILEIINPATGEQLPEGETGELVLTTLKREAMPIIRYRTRDITSIIPEPCACGRTHRRLRRITDLLHDAYGERLSIEQLATMAGMSRYAFIRAFRAATGMAPHAYQLDLRINAARRLLRDGCALTAVAHDLGFADQAHFQRAFKERVAMTPGAYRRAAGS